MGYLQLAEQSNIQFYNSLAEPSDLYVFVPDSDDGATGKWVREDYFDGLDPMQWEEVMNFLAPYQPEQLSGIFSNIRENIQARRERRDERKDARQSSRMARIEGREGGIFGGKLKNLIGSFIPDTSTQQFPAPTQRGVDLQFTTQPEQTFMQRNPWVLPVGIVAGLGIGYLALRKKK